MADANFRVFHYLSWGALAICFAILLIIAFMLFAPVTTSVYPPNDFEVSPRDVPVGGIINMHLVYEKHTDLPANITVSFVDGTLVEFVSYKSFRRAGHYDHWRAVAVPRALPPGKYYLLLVIEYHVNPLRTERVTTRSECFYIVPECKKPGR